MLFLILRLSLDCRKGVVSRFLYWGYCGWLWENGNSGHTEERFFESTFKATKIESEEQFLHVSRYIHLNPVIARLVEKPEQWHWSSYREYMNLVSHDLCDTKSILSLFSSNEKYQKFVLDQKEYGMLLKEMEHEEEKYANFSRAFWQSLYNQGLALKYSLEILALK